MDNDELLPIDVHGRIVNEKGEPVAGASVVVKDDKTKGTSTDADGYFELKGLKEGDVLLITATNIEDRAFTVTPAVAVSSDTQLITVKNKVAEGEEVQIMSTGYQDIPKERATGSFTFLSGEKLDKRIAPDIISKLEGITNGLVFNKGAQGANKLRIRGESTIYGYTEPLIIVDNLIF